MAVALARNEGRSLSAVEKRKRKAMGSKVDILFRIGNDEVGAREVGKTDVMVVDDKYLDDGLTKLPKTLRDMLAVLVQKCPAKVNQLFTIGYLMMGLNLELVMMDCPVGSAITRVSKTMKLNFPSSITTVHLDLIPLLEATWKGKNAMATMGKIINDRKRKAVELKADIEYVSPLSYSFIRQ